VTWGIWAVHSMGAMARKGAPSMHYCPSCDVAHAHSTNHDRLDVLLSCNTSCKGCALHLILGCHSRVRRCHMRARSSQPCAVRH
jgi:hypothetical protein